MHTRRTFAALGAAGFASACATTARAPTPSFQLAPVIVSEERMIRADVGLRPYRPNGFRVEREAFGEKTLVHNYGHGGGGITLSWGTAHLALELGYDSSVSEYAVLGCGAVGLATARLLQERGARVRLYAKDLPPNTTSNVAGAQWWPASVYSTRREQSPHFMDQFHQAARFAFLRFQTLAGPEFGVSWERNFQVSERPIRNYPAAEDSSMRALVVNQRDYAPGEHPFEAPHVRGFDTMMIETPRYLRQMERDVRIAGGEIVVRAFTDAAEIAALPEPVIFNCTGLGAGELFGDAEIMPMRGQLAILEPQPDVDYNVLGGGYYMFGRADGIVLGGTFERGEWSLEPDPADIARIIAGNRDLLRLRA